MQLSWKECAQTKVKLAQAQYIKSRTYTAVRFFENMCIFIVISHTCQSPLIKTTGQLSVTQNSQSHVWQQCCNLIHLLPHLKFTSPWDNLDMLLNLIECNSTQFIIILWQKELLIFIKCLNSTELLIFHLDVF